MLCNVEEVLSKKQMKSECDMHSADVMAICLGDINGHIGRHIDGWT